MVVMCSWIVPVVGNDFRGSARLLSFNTFQKLALSLTEGSITRSPTTAARSSHPKCSQD